MLIEFASEIYKKFIFFFPIFATLCYEHKYLAFYSNARFLSLAFDQMIKSIQVSGRKMPKLTFTGRSTKTLIEI